MTKLKHHFEFALPLVLGLYSLIQGGALAANADPLVRLVGFCLLFWVPGCAHYTWRGRNAWLQQGRPVERTAGHEEKQVETRIAA